MQYKKPLRAQSNQIILQPGDRIFCWSLLKRHYGVFAGNGWVLHNMPGRGEHFTSYDEFRTDREVFLEKRCSPQDLPEVMMMLQAKAGNPQAYDLIGHNCEHTAMEVTEQKSVSYQVNGWGTIGGIALLALLLA
jgi:hypothetical protein